MRRARTRYVLFDVDGTLMDADEVRRVALRTRPTETFAQVAADRDPRECLAALHELEDEDVRSGVYAAFDGAAELLHRHFGSLRAAVPHIVAFATGVNGLLP